MQTKMSNFYDGKPDIIIINKNKQKFIKYHHELINFICQLLTYTPKEWQRYFSYKIARKTELAILEQDYKKLFKISVQAYHLYYKLKYRA